jgi:hypothetical protein
MGNTTSQCIVRRYLTSRSLNLAYKHKILELKEIYTPNEAAAIPITTPLPLQ